MTGTEIELVQTGPSAIEAWVDDFTRLAEVSGALSRTAFIPVSLRVFRDEARRSANYRPHDYDAEATAAQVTAAILTGQELGLDRIASLRSIDIVQGTPALRAIALRAILQAHGHEIWVEEATNNRATVAGQRKGSEHVQRVTWTLDDARARGLAGKSNWRSQPRNMLIARATSEVARLVAADALLGVPYTAEELEDADGVEVLDAPPAAGPRRARRATQPRQVLANRPPVAEQPAAPEDEPPLDEAPAEPVVVDEAPEAEPDEVEQAAVQEHATQAQLRMMHALLSDANIIERDDRLSFVSLTIEREIASSSDLTIAEASTVIDKLRSLPPVEP
jgi:hypothetical protein